jgi:hypothetical protein
MWRPGFDRERAVARVIAENSCGASAASNDVGFLVQP